MCVTKRENKKEDNVENEKFEKTTSSKKMREGPPSYHTGFFFFFSRIQGASWLSSKEGWAPAARNSSDEEEYTLRKNKRDQGNLCKMFLFFIFYFLTSRSKLHLRCVAYLTKSQHTTKRAAYDVISAQEAGQVYSATGVQQNSVTSTVYYNPCQKRANSKTRSFQVHHNITDIR
jgi:hypothetical protein